MSIGFVLCTAPRSRYARDEPIWTETDAETSLFRRQRNFRSERHAAFKAELAAVCGALSVLSG